MATLKFLVSLITQDNDYQMEQAHCAQLAAAKLDVDVAIAYSNNDTITQSTQILKAIQTNSTERPNAVILEPAGGTALPQVARAAVAEGIGWAVLNRDASYLAELRQTGTVPVFGVSSDQIEVGRISGRQCAALLPHGGSIL